MSFSLVISSINYSGQVADISFSAVTGGSIVIIGEHVIPYTYVTDYYYGEYTLYFSAFNQTCIVTVIEPEPEILNAIITEEDNVYIEPAPGQYLIYVDPP